MVRHTPDINVCIYYQEGCSGGGPKNTRATVDDSAIGTARQVNGPTRCSVDCVVLRAQGTIAWTGLYRTSDKDKQRRSATP